jgi:sRNA-binding protein
LKTTTADDVLATLAELFPACFVARHYEPHRPLKIGIRQDLGGILTEAEVNAALFRYCSRLMYQRALAAGGPRFDLDGAVAGEVAADEVEHAKHAVARIEAARAKRVAAEKAARRSGKTPPPKRPTAVPTHQQSPPRLGLADLKAAALARRTGAL